MAKKNQGANQSKNMKCVHGGTVSKQLIGTGKTCSKSDCVNKGTAKCICK